MSTFAYCPNYPSEFLPVELPGNSVASKEASRYQRTLLERFLVIAEPIFEKTFFGKSLRAFKKLENVFGEVFAQIDEGYDIPLDKVAFQNVLTFMLLMPDDIPLPNLELEDGGQITLEWYKDKWNIFSVVMDGSGLYYYAGLFGSKNDMDKGRKLFSEGIDENVLRSIRRLQD